MEPAECILKHFLLLPREWHGVETSDKLDDDINDWKLQTAVSLIDH